MILAERGGMTVRLAGTEGDVRAAQRLRYTVFYEELAAKADAQVFSSGRDEDRFDQHCDHLLVHHGDMLVGTYRLLRQEKAERTGGFYSSHEFDLAPLLAKHASKSFLEVGRSCVAKDYRGKSVAELLFQGIWNYVRHHQLDVMLGCASLPGVNVEALKPELAFLARAIPQAPEWKVEALPTRRIPMVSDVAFDSKAVLRNLPTLLKAYLRLGCTIGDGAVLDHQFNTTDVLVVLPVANINPRYFKHYGPPTTQ
jgi:putative hemolysin